MYASEHTKLRFNGTRPSSIETESQQLAAAQTQDFDRRRNEESASGGPEN